MILQEKLSHVPLLVMANKQDLMSASTPAEVSAHGSSFFVAYI